MSGFWKCLAATVLLLSRGTVASESLPEKIDRLVAERKFGEARLAAAELVAQCESGRSGPALPLARARQMQGQLQDLLGEHRAAAATLTKALAEFSNGGAGPEELGACADAAGLAAHAAGDFPLAETLLRRALESREQAGNPAWTAATQAHLGDLFLKTGRLEAAAAMLQQASATAPPDSAAHLMALHRTALLHQASGGYEEAVSLLEKALPLAAKDPVNAAAIGNDLGLALFRLGRLDEASRHLQAAETILLGLPRAALPPETLLSCANNLAALWLQRDDPAKAVAHLEKAIAEAKRALGAKPAAVLLPPLMHLEVALHRAGRLEDARRAGAEFNAAAQLLLPPAHLLRVQQMQNAAALAADQGNPAEAARLAAAGFEAACDWLDQLSAFGAEDRLLEFRRTTDPFSPLAAFCSADARLLADSVLAVKNRALDEALQLRRWMARATPAAAAQWHSASAMLQTASLTEGPLSLNAIAARDRLDALRRSLPAREKRTPVSAASLQRALPEGAALVDFIRFQPHVGRGKWDASGRYGVVILTKTMPPRWVDLGPAAAIDDQVRRTLTKGAETVATAGMVTGARLLSILSRLGRTLWGKILPELAGVQRLLLRPDGLLHFVPWAVLPLPDAPLDAPVFFCQRFPRVQVIAFPAAAPAHRLLEHWRMLAVPEKPAAGAGDAPPGLKPPLSTPLWRQLSMMPGLAGVTREIAAVRMAAQQAKATLEVLSPAWEAQLLPAGKPAPDILHLSGHGFALPDPPGAGTDPMVLFRSGIVLSDCAAGLQAAAEGRPKATSTDGILFAAETAALPLTGTALVVLSACQTGVGRPEAGEHLAGLRRAFLAAGAGHVAASLWDLDDACVPVFVSAFYGHLASLAPADALWQTQRGFLNALQPQDPPAAVDLRAAHAGAWIVECAGWQPE